MIGTVVVGVTVSVTGSVGVGVTVNVIGTVGVGVIVSDIGTVGVGEGDTSSVGETAKVGVGDTVLVIVTVGSRSEFPDVGVGVDSSSITSPRWGDSRSADYLLAQWDQGARGDSLSVPSCDRHRANLA